MDVPLPHLLVLTDISSLTAGVREPDDGQSLIRLLVHANELSLVGLCATSNMGHGKVCRPELIHETLRAYAQVQANLRLHDKRFPAFETLSSVVRSGNPSAGPDVAVQDCVGGSYDSDASRHIIKATDEATAKKEPLHIAVWGGTCDLAQALWRVAQERSPKEAASFRATLRVHAVYDQDSTGQWIKATFPDVWYLTRYHGIRGMYRGGDTALVGPEWVEKQIRPYGPLGALYPNYNGGDIWARRLGPVRGIKEGDTPS